MKIKRCLNIIICLILSIYNLKAQDPKINEFLTSNDNGLIDGNGDNSDWIEIYNPSSSAINLTGWHLTDDSGDLTKYTFPNGSTIPAGGYQIVFASKDTTPPSGEWHANFSLSSNGEYLALVKPDGTTITSEFSPEYPKQRTNYSYGPDSTGTLKYFSTPTPGAANGNSGVLGFVGDTTFSHKRGFYDATFNLTITTSEPGSTIRYTTDGSEPTQVNGDTYFMPIPITNTTTLRVRAYKTGFLETNVDTQTYIFAAQVIDQTADQPNYPRIPYSLGTGGQTALHDYEMDPAIVTSNPVERNKMIAALKDIPTVSLVTNRNDMFGNGGFYDDSDFQSRTSVEVIYPNAPDDSEQADGGVEGHSHERLKRSLRLNFKKSLGDSNFKTNLFRAMPWNLKDKNEHDSIILRGGNNRAWSRNWSRAKCSFAIDELARQSQLATSGYGMRGSYVHLYINGLYWGMYNAVERANDDFAERYFGGDKNDWTARNHGGSFAGASDSRYNYLTSTLKNKDMSLAANYAELQDYLDIDGYIDYLLIQWLNRTTDWPNNNWYAVNRNANPLNGTTSSPLRYLTWDSEWSWNLPRSGNQTDPWVHTDFTQNRSKNHGAPLARIFNSAKDNPTFLRKLSDRAYKHLMNSGSLTDAAMLARYTAITNTIEKSVLAESARWGDSLKGIGEPTYTRDGEWRTEVNVIKGMIPNRASKLMTALRNQNYYPNINPPTLNQRGGDVIAGFNVTLSNPNSAGIIRYTLDGSDPADGPALTYSSPINITEATQIRTRIQSGSVWSAEDDVTFFIPGPPTLVISEIMYNPTEPSAAEFAAGHTDDDDFEYIELHNTGANPIELENIVFTLGINYTFPQHTLAAGERVIVAADPAAFAFRYGAGSTVFGGFTSGKLSNGGETVRLESALGELITEITYDDNEPWPTGADGDGFSLVFIGGSAADPSSWRRSSLTGGSPGTEDTSSYTAWIDRTAPDYTPAEKTSSADPDGDGISNLVEYAFDLDPLIKDADKLPGLTHNGTEISVTYDVANFKTDILIAPQTTENLNDWTPIFFTSVDQPSPVGFQRKKVTLDATRPRVLFRFRVTQP